MGRRAKFLTGAALIVAAVGALVFTAARETSSYYMTMEEYARSPEAQAGAPLRLAGRVASGSVKWSPTTLDLEFLIQPIPPRAAGGSTSGGVAEAGSRPGEGAVAERPAAPLAAGLPVGSAQAEAAFALPAVAGATLPVRYNGVLPDMFGDGRDVIVEGRVQGGVFEAKALLTTCPSKYEAEAREAEAGSEAGSEAGREAESEAGREAGRGA